MSLLICVEITLNSSLDVFSYTSVLKVFNVVIYVNKYASDSVSICFINIRPYFCTKNLHAIIITINYYIQFNRLKLRTVTYYNLTFFLLKIRVENNKF